MKNIYVQAALFAAIALSSTAALASKPATSGDDDAQSSGSCAANGLKVATGAKDKGYSLMFADMQAVCGSKIPLCEVHTSGGLANLTALVNKKADIAPAQLDTLKEMSNGNEAISSLKVVMPLNYNYLHVLTSTNGYRVPSDKKKWGFLTSDPELVIIHKFSDLKNRTVTLVGSAQQLGASWAQHQLKEYNLHFTYSDTDAQAIAKIKSGEAQAMFTVSAAPFPVIDKLTMKDGVSMIPFDEDFGGAYTVRKITYSGIGANNMRVLAIPNVLLTRDFSEQKAALVGQFAQCLVDNLTALKDGDYQPAWNEINPKGQVDAPRFNPPAAAVRKTK